MFDVGLAEIAVCVLVILLLVALSVIRALMEERKRKP